MQKCLSLVAWWHDSSFKAEHEFTVPAQVATLAVLATVVVD
jgi:hypothetical protein